MSRRRNSACSLFLAPALLLAVASGAPAQITLDGSLGGPAGAVPNVGGTFTIEDTAGVAMGGNLFHSFSDFNVPAATTALFETGGFANILSRVTGMNASTINGRIQTDGPAGFFFMNPNGVIFGSGAVLDINGPSAFTTGHYLRMSDGSQFFADPGGATVLSSMPVSAYGFMPAPMTLPAEIEFQGTTTSSATVFADDDVSLVAGDVTMTNARLNVPANDFTIVSVASMGEVGVGMPGTAPDVSGFADLGTVSMDGSGRAQSRIDTSGGPGGRIVIRAGRLEMTNFDLRSDTTTGSTVGRGIDVEVTGDANLTRSTVRSWNSGSMASPGPITVKAQRLDMEGSGTLDAQITSTTFNAAQGATVSVEADEVELRGEGGRAARIESVTIGAGAAGRVELDVADELRIENGGIVRATTFGAGPAGTVEVDAHDGEIIIDGESATTTTGLTAQTIQQFSPMGGPGGSVDILSAGAVTIRRGGVISASTNSTGSAGDVSLVAESLTIDGSMSGFQTGIIVASEDTDTGPAGGIDITVSGPIQIFSAGRISGNTSGLGDGGDIIVRGGSLEADGMGSAFTFTGITAISLAVAGASGQAGNITVDLGDGDLTLRDGALIDSSTFGGGAAGNVEVFAGDVFVDRAGSLFFTGIGSDTELAVGGGAGGAVTVEADSVTLRNGGLISTGTFGSADAGDVTVRAAAIDIAGMGLPTAFVVTERSGIVAATGAASTGNGGNVTIDTGPAGALAVTDKGLVGANSLGMGNAGSVRVDGGDVSVAREGSISSASDVAGDAGSIEIYASAVNLSEMGDISSSSTGTGNAGSVIIRSDSDVSLASGSTVAVASLLTDAGAIDIWAAYGIFVNDSSITASAGNDGGSITLSANELISLTDGRVEAEAQNDGGNVLFEDALFAVLNRSRISANAIFGDGGNILINTFGFFSNASEVTASSQFGAPGTVSIDAISDLSGSEAELDAGLLDASDQLQPRCSAKIPGGTGSFILVGRGGLPLMPGRYLPSHRLLPLPEG